MGKSFFSKNIGKRFIPAAISTAENMVGGVIGGMAYKYLTKPAADGSQPPFNDTTGSAVMFVGLVAARAGIENQHVQEILAGAGGYLGPQMGANYGLFEKASVGLAGADDIGEVGGWDTAGSVGEYRDPFVGEVGGNDD